MSQPSRSALFATWLVTAAGVAGVIVGLARVGVLELSLLQTASAAGVAGSVCGGLAGLGVWRYQITQYDLACDFAARTYQEELLTWQADCERIDERHRLNVERILAVERDERDEIARRVAERDEAGRKWLLQEKQKEEARHERERLAAEAARAAEMAREQAAEIIRLRTARVRTALAWWTTEHPHIEERARCFWSDIINQAAKYRARYDDPADPCATLERCHELAAWALETMPSEVRHFLADGAPSVAELASILRRHHGHEVEELLPLARSCQRAERLRPTPEPAGALAAEASPFADLLADLPAAMRSELSKKIHAVIHMDEVRSIAAKVVEYRKRQLETDGVAHNVIDERLADLDENLGRATREFARKRGLV